MQATTVLMISFALAGIAAVLALLVPDRRVRSFAAGGCCAVASAAGVVAGALALAGHSAGGVVVATVVPGVDLGFAPDRLGGLFLLLVSGIGTLTAISGAGSARGAAASRTGWVSFAAFLAGMQAVASAAGIGAFLTGWEVMGLASTALVLAEHRERRGVGSATVWYAAMSQVSFVAILAGFATLGAAAHGASFTDLRVVDPHSAAAGWAFCLLTLGFGTKMGLVPVHVWLPRAHPEAPSHVSAAMSAAMVKLGAYGLLLICVRLLPGAPGWWGVVLLVVGGVSAGYGILRASVTSDVKALLASSTTENLGLITLAVGAFVMLRDAGEPGIASVALLAALLLCLSHAAFKVTLFLSAGAILHGSGERDLDAMGGLGARMPATALAFGAAAMGAAALPVSAGFAAEWVLLQSLVHATRAHGSALPLVDVLLMPAAVAVVALTAGLAVLTFVKAYGIAFLGRPRSPGAAAAHEPGALERTVPLVGAALVFALGLVPGAVTSALLPIIPGAAAAGVRGLGPVGILLPGLDAVLSPVAVIGLAAAGLVPVLVVSAVWARRRPPRAVAIPWGGGGAQTSPRLQYTATSFGEPALRVFDDVLNPRRDVTVTHADESGYLVERVRTELELGDVIERRAYRPALRALDRLGLAARRIHNGSVHRYLAYSFAAVLVVLAVAAR